MSGAVLMVQGCASSVGKSLLTTGLCRLFRRRGLSVAPFKAQNMSLNSYVTVDGGEIGRAQAVQADAAGIGATVDMNPVLLKPEGEANSQVIVLGKPLANMSARDYHERKRSLSDVVQGSLERLRAQYDLVVIEGAGSPAEINLRSRDIVNMHVALMAKAPVLLVGDIDRGGVFAHFVGTLALLQPEERALVAGLVINKFRGDVSLLHSGVEMIEERTQVPMLGIVPFVKNLRIADEDSVSLDHRRTGASSPEDVVIAVVRFPRISNFDDFLALEHEAGVVVRYVETAGELDGADLVVLPGTKDTRSDLAWLRSTGMDVSLRKRAQAHQLVLGICGGYQMLGQIIEDPYGVEGSAGSMEGLGLLPIRTSFQKEKTTVRVRAQALSGASNFLTSKLDEEPVEGYEIHMGHVQGTVEGPWLFAHDNGRKEGKAQGSVAGTLLHGLFENESVRRCLLMGLRPNSQAFREAPQIATLDEEYERLADVLEESLDLARIEKLLVGTEAIGSESASSSAFSDMIQAASKTQR